MLSIIRDDFKVTSFLLKWKTRLLSKYLGLPIYFWTKSALCVIKLGPIGLSMPPNISFWCILQTPSTTLLTTSGNNLIFATMTAMTRTKFEGHFSDLIHSKWPFYENFVLDVGLVECTQIWIIQYILHSNQGYCREETIRFLFLPKMGLLGSQAGNEKKLLVVNYEQLLRAVFSCFYGQNFNFLFTL